MATIERTAEEKQNDHAADAAIDSGAASPVPSLPSWACDDLRRYRTAYAEGRAIALAKLAAVRS